MSLDKVMHDMGLPAVATQQWQPTASVVAQVEAAFAATGLSDEEIRRRVAESRERALGNLR